KEGDVAARGAGARDATAESPAARMADTRDAKDGVVAAHGAEARDAKRDEPAGGKVAEPASAPGREGATAGAAGEAGGGPDAGARMADTRDAKDGGGAAHGAEARDAKRDEPRGGKVAEPAWAPGREGATARAAGETGGGPDAGARVDRGAARGRPDRVAGVC